MSRRLVVAALLLFVAAPAVGADETAPAQGAAGAGGAAGATSAAGAPKPAVVAPTKQQRKKYIKALRAGQKLGAKKKWGNAVKQFEAALAAIPGDPRALSELGWAAFNAGDYPKARRATTEALRAVVDPKLKAASLYNLGRIHEASGDHAAAARAYTESLALRANDIVAKRLAALDQATVAAASQPDPLPCAAARAWTDVCDCLQQEAWADYDNSDPDWQRVCEWVEPPDAVGGFKVARLDISQSESNFYLVAGMKDKWRVVADLGYLYQGGIAGVSGTWSLDVLTIKKLGKHRVLWVEGVESHSDSDLGIDEVETLDTRTLTLCVFGNGLAVTCPLQTIIAQDYVRDRLGVTDDADMDADVKKLQTPGLPMQWKVLLDVTLTEDGTATVILKEGELRPELQTAVGPHKLW